MRSGARDGEDVLPARRGDNRRLQLLFGESDALGGQLGGVVGLQKGVVESGVFLRQQEGLVAFAVGVDVAQVQPGEQPAVAPLAGEDDPSAIAGPTVPRVDGPGLSLSI